MHRIWDNEWFTYILVRCVDLQLHYKQRYYYKISAKTFRSSNIEGGYVAANAARRARLEDRSALLST